jgi:hypothetical protein
MKDFADINNDNIRDVIAMYGFSGGVFALSGDDGQQIWTASLGSSNNGTIETLDDKDKNGFNDLILSGPQTAYRIDSKSGQTLWSFSPSASYLRDADILDDINNDTIAEVLISTQQPGRVYVLNGADGQMLFQYEFGSSISYRADRVLKINSIDGNLYKDFVAGCRDGRLKCFSSGQGSIIGINPVNNDVPKDFLLAHNFPNPFNPVTKIKFSIPVSDKILNSNVKISVFDILGREVETLINEVLQPGTYEVEFDGTNYPSGLYFYTLSSSHFTESRKMILIK